MVLFLSLFLLALLFAIASFSPWLAVGCLVVVSTVESVSLSIGWLTVPLPLLTIPVVLLGARMGQETENLIQPNPFFWLAAPIAGAELVSIPLSIHPVAALGSATQAILFLLAAWYFTLRIQAQSGVTRFRFLLYGTVVLSFFLSIGQFLGRAPGVPFHATGGFQDWNYYPVYLMSLLPFITMEIRSAEIGWIKRIFMATFAGIVLLALAAASRTGMVIIAATLLLLFVFHLVDRKYLKWLIPLFFLAFYQLIQILGHQSLSLSEKMNQWLASPRLQDRFFTNLYALQTWIRHPFLGVGSGQLEAYVQWESIQAAERIQSSYTTLPVLLAERGLIGGLAYLALVVRLFSLFQSPRDPKSLLHRAAFCSLCSLCVSSFFFSVHTQLFTWCLLGFLFAIATGEESKTTPAANESA